jgi:predicted dehydrogenase
MTRRFRYAVVGTRFWAEGFHLPGLAARDDVELAALCGRDRARAQSVADKFSIPHIYADWREMIAREKLDGVAITTPNWLHHPIALAAMDAGLDVICEKPLALNAAQAREMLARARGRNCKHLVMFDFRAMPAARRAKELIDTGFVGRVFHVIAIYQHASYLDPARPFAWRMSKAESGTGVLGDLGSHIIDLTRWWVGDFARVVGHLPIFNRERPQPHSAERVTVDADDAVSFIAEMADGAQAVFHASKMAVGRGNAIRIEVYGSEGALVLDADPGGRSNWIGSLYGARRGEKVFGELEIASRLSAGFETSDHTHSLGSAFRVMTDPFFAAIRSGADAADVPSNFADGLAAQQVIDAVARSAENGKWEQVGS